MKTIEWQYLIVSYLFLGGLSAGLYFVSALTELFRKDDDSAQEHIARLGALLASWPVMLGCTLLVFDLGHWYRAYKLFLHFRWESPMSIGSWLLMLFIGISLIYAYGWTSRDGREHFFGRLPRRLRFLGILNVDVAPWRRPLAIAGLPVSVGVAIYTGVLLGAVQSRPFWNTNLVAQLFLFSALSSGCALLILVLAMRPRKFEMYQFRSLYLLDVCFLTLEFFIVVPYFIHGELSVEAVRESLKLVLGGRSPWCFGCFSWAWDWCFPGPSKCAKWCRCFSPTFSYCLAWVSPLPLRPALPSPLSVNSPHSPLRRTSYISAAAGPSRLRCLCWWAEC